MRSSLTVIGALTLIAAPTLALAAASPERTSSQHSAVSHPGTVLEFTVPWNGGHSRSVDLGRHGLSVGDEFFTSDQPAYATGSKRRIGTMDGSETIVSIAHHGTVLQNGTLRLRHGLIMFAGIARHTDQPLRLAVTGGTGQYARATGQLTVVSEDDQAKTTTLELELTR